MTTKIEKRPAFVLRPDESLESNLRRALHELNNVLSPQLILPCLIQETLPSTDPLHEELSEVVAATRRAATIVRQLRDHLVSKPNS